MSYCLSLSQVLRLHKCNVSFFGFLHGVCRHVHFINSSTVFLVLAYYKRFDMELDKTRGPLRPMATQTSLQTPLPSKQPRIIY